MKLLDYTPASGLLPRLKCTDWSSTIERLVATLVDVGSVSDAAGLVAEIEERELKGSTAIGGGLAIPHARFAAVDRVQIVFSTLARPIDIPAEDDKPVDVVILLVGPLGDPRLILRVLARLARLVKSGDFVEALRSAADPDAMRAVIARAEQSNR